MEESSKTLIGECRLSYCNLFTPRKAEGAEKEAYSVCLIIPKDNQQCLDRIKNAIKVAKQESAGLFGGKVPAGLKTCINDGDEKRADDAAFENCYYINVKSMRKPGLFKLGPKVNGSQTYTPITDEEELYSGCYAYAKVRFYGYNRNGNKGIACGLEHVIKVKDGERLGGGVEDVNKAFAGVDFSAYLGAPQVTSTVEDDDDLPF